MLDILDTPEHTTLERAREAVRFGGINLENIVRYLKSGSPDDRLAQADYYRKLTRKARNEKILGATSLIIIILALATPWFIL